MQNIIASTASDIKSMKVRGAGRIARAAATALVEYAEGYEGKALGKFKKDIAKAEKTLLGTRPTAVSLLYSVGATIKDVERADTFEKARQSIVKNGKRFLVLADKAEETIIRVGARRIKDGDVIMTHCNSSLAIGVITEAARQGKNIRVYATESRPWRQGIITVNDLAKAGIDTTLIVDSAVRTAMRRTDRVFVGADTVTSAGDLINKIGTSQMALCAYEAGVEFNVCSETYKFSSQTLFGDTVTIEERDMGEVVRKGEVPKTVKVFNPVFDRTPAKYINNVITELGVMPPGSVYSIMAHLLGERLFNLP